MPGQLDDPYTNEGETQTFTVNADGSYTKLDSMTLHVNNEAGVARAAQQYVWFNRKMADVETSKPTRPPPRRAPRRGTRSDPRRAGSPLVRRADVQDILEKVIVFPAVEPGARVHLTYRKTQSSRSCPASSATSRRPPRADPQLPPDLRSARRQNALRRCARFHRAATRDANGRTRYEYRYDKAHFSRLERGSIAYVSYGDRLMVSTFPDYATFATSYQSPRRTRASTRPPSRVSRKSSPRTTPPRATKPRRCTIGSAATSATWRSTSGVARPCRISASEILANRYGDCKDHVAL